MCLIAIAHQPGDSTRLLLAANRDEFHARPTQGLHWWAPDQRILGGRDEQAGGGWMAIDRRGRVAAVTNVRRMLPPDPAARSRGHLVGDFLRDDRSATDFLDALKPEARQYGGFNLLLHDGRTLQHASNADGFEHQAVPAGVHALSNASLNTPWPKVCRLQQRLQDWLADGNGNTEPLFAALADDVTAADDELPDTGVGAELEKLLSPPFIRSPRYGTRASSVLSLDATGLVQFEERRFDADGEPAGRTVERFTIGNA